MQAAVVLAPAGPLPARGGLAPPPALLHHAAADGQGEVEAPRIIHCGRLVGPGCWLDGSVRFASRMGKLSASLECATGASNRDVAALLGVGEHTVSRWRARFVRDRLEGLTDEPRPGGPPKITDAQVEEVVVRTLETTPKDATHCSTRSMAKEVRLSQSDIARIWRTFGLKRHLVHLQAPEGAGTRRESARAGEARPHPRGGSPVGKVRPTYAAQHTDGHAAITGEVFGPLLSVVPVDGTSAAQDASPSVIHDQPLIWTWISFPSSLRGADSAATGGDTSWAAG